MQFSIYPFFLILRTIVAVSKIRPAGSQIQIISLKITFSPRSPKNLKPIGDTSTGRHGKKYLSLLKGVKSATPEPPLVSISSSGCEKVDNEKKTKSLKNGISVFRILAATKAASAPNRRAKAIECVKPRCENIPPRSAPSQRVATSASGMIAQTAVKNQNHQGINLAKRLLPATAAKTA